MRTGLVFRGVAFGLWLLMLLPGAAAEELRDPMRPPDLEAETDSVDTTAAPRPELALQSTLVAGSRRSAVINGRSVHVGSTIRGARVVDIDASRVHLRDSQGVFTLRLPSTRIKRRAGNGDSR